MPSPGVRMGDTALRTVEKLVDRAAGHLIETCCDQAGMEEKMRVRKFELCATGSQSMCRERAGLISGLAILLIALPMGARAQWTAVSLQPAGSDYSLAFGVGGGQQAGYAYPGSVARASLWTGSAGSWVNLNPVGASSSYAYCADGSQQVGRADVGGVFHAGVWSGTAATWVDLNPAGAANSYAWGVGGRTTGGTRRFGRCGAR